MERERLAAVVAKAVVFDVGGVLERVEDVGLWLTREAARLGLERSAFDERLALVDPRGFMGTGQMSEAAYRRRFMDVFERGDLDADAFMVDMWDWYCGELDTELVEFVRGLRPAYQTAILSNSADGARREEQRRYGFEQLVDVIIYSHEVGLEKPDPRIYALACDRLGVQPREMVFLDDKECIVESARRFGIYAIHHRHTPDSIAAIQALLVEHGSAG